MKNHTSAHEFIATANENPLGWVSAAGRGQEGTQGAMHGLKCIFFYVPLSPSGVLQLVETLEGDVLVLRDGQPFGGYRWSGEQIADAVDAFRRIAANLQRESWPGELFTDRPYSAPPREQTDRANVHATR